MTRRGESGFTLIETILGLTVMMIMITAVTQLFLSNLQTLTLGKARALGLSLATEKMENLRDLPYDSLATQLGAIYPPGAIADETQVTVNGYRFWVRTEISYVDDPYDNLAPTDAYPYDYKKAQIGVYLVSTGKQVAVLTSDFAGKAAETSSNTGIIRVTVIDANGDPVPNAVVHITNPAPTPDVDITATTDVSGIVMIPKLPPDSSNRYQVTASLSGYSTDGTIPDPAGSQTAVQPNVNILAQQITSVTLSIDRISTLNVHVVDTSGNPVPNLAVVTTGAKKTKRTPDVYKYSQTSTTDGSGNIALAGLEWDSYSFAVSGGYQLVSTSPYAPASLLPSSSQSVNLVVSTSGSYPRITTMTPVTGRTGTTGIGLLITGANLTSSSTITLRKSGSSDIVVGSITSASGNTKLSGSLNLTGAATGPWDVVVTNGGGTVTQVGGFTVAP